MVPMRVQESMTTKIILLFLRFVLTIERVRRKAANQRAVAVSKPKISKLLSPQVNRAKVAKI
jgi:hypothetical protein